MDCWYTLHLIFIFLSRITISHFPKCVKKLALRNCTIVNINPKRSYLFEIDKLFPCLQILDLENGNWLSNHSLQSISKSQSLREVNFQGCRQLGECFVYSALSTRFGFRNVKTIDLRDTHVGDSELPCFGRLPNITHLYLGKYVQLIHRISSLSLSFHLKMQKKKPIKSKIKKESFSKSVAQI